MNGGPAEMNTIFARYVTQHVQVYVLLFQQQLYDLGSLRQNCDKQRCLSVHLQKNEIKLVKFVALTGQHTSGRLLCRGFHSAMCLWADFPRAVFEPTHMFSVLTFLAKSPFLPLSHHKTN